jgi:hypothetical protein
MLLIVYHKVQCSSNWIRRVWRYQRGNQNPYIEEEQTTQWPKEKVQKDKQRSTKKTSIGESDDKISITFTILLWSLGDGIVLSVMYVNGCGYRYCRQHLFMFVFYYITSIYCSIFESNKLMVFLFWSTMKMIIINVKNRFDMSNCIAKHKQSRIREAKLQW